MEASQTKKPMVLRDIFELDQNHEKLLKILQEWKVIGVEGEFQCPESRCGGIMELVPTEASVYVDGFLWTCKNKYKTRSKNTITCRKRVSIRSGSFFANSHLSIVQIIAFVRLWMKNVEIGTIQEECGIGGSATATDWNSFCREVVLDACFSRSKPIGGEGKTVEIDESKFGRRKYHKGHRVEGQWVFGGVERESGNFFLLPVEKRDRDTLIPLIQKWILPGTTIISDCWSSYSVLSELDYEHLTVNHSVTFKDPVTDAHTNNVEGLWRHAKHRIPQYRRVKSFFLGYLARFMFTTQCRRQNLNPTEEFMKAAGVVYNVNDRSSVADGDVERDPELDDTCDIFV